MAQLREYDNLGRDERLRRVGEILCKAVFLAGRKDGDTLEVCNTATTDPVSKQSSLPPLDQVERQLVDKLNATREIAPRDATELWQVSRTTAYRRLTKLERAGWVEKHGSTIAIRYRLTPQGRADLQQVNQAVQGTSAPRR